MTETEDKLDKNETYLAKYIRETAKKMGIEELPQTIQALKTIGEISVGLTALSAMITQVTQQIATVRNEIGGTIEYVDSLKDYAFTGLPENINNANEALANIKDGLYNATEYLNINSGVVMAEVVQAKGYADPLLKMIEKHPVGAAASLVATGYLGYTMYNRSDRLENNKNKLSLALKEEEENLEKKFNQLGEHLKDKDDYNLVVLNVFCEKMVEKYKESNEIDANDIEQIKYIIEHDLELIDLPAEKITAIEKGSLELIASVEKCAQLKQEISQDKSSPSFVRKVKQERNREESATKER